MGKIKKCETQKHITINKINGKNYTEINGKVDWTTTNKTELKEGDKLYNIVYYDFGGKSERNWESYTIKKIKGNRIYLKGGYHWTFSLADLGNKVFASKREATEHTLKLHKEKLEGAIEPLQEEIKYLEKKLLELKKGDWMEIIEKINKRWIK